MQYLLQNGFRRRRWENRLGLLLLTVYLAVLMLAVVLGVRNLPLT